MIKSISILELDASFQIRVETSEEKVAQYAEYFLEHNDWGDFPPLDVVQIDGKCYIADGIHRFNAAKRAEFEEVPCNVTSGTRWELFKRSIAKNGIQGLGMSRADLEHFRRMLLEEFPEKTLEELGEMGQCSHMTIKRLKLKMIEEGHVFPETTIGADGKEYPTKKKNSVFTNVKTENPDSQSESEESANPFEDSVLTNVKTQNDMHFCANGCGTPIWDEMKNDPNSTYCEEGGKWFCSPTCLDEYQVKARVEEAESLTGIKDELPPLPSAAVKHEQNNGSEGYSAPKELKTYYFSAKLDVLATSEEDAIQKIKALDINNINNNININININSINNINAQRSKIETLPESEKTDFKWILNDGSEWELSKSMLDQFRKLYPGIDVERELNACIGWSLSNPKKRKTKAGILNHINTWLGNEQNRSRVPSNTHRSKYGIDESGLVTAEGY